VTTPLRPGDPRQLGGYHLLSRLGEGGMGTVYLGRDPGGRLVAIKVIRPEYAYEDEFRARFRSEVNRARQVPPFCTAEVLDADPEHHTPYLVVEFVDGPSLAEVVHEQGPLTAGSLHSVAIGVATALAAIHGAGVIHRDLKPRNVLFSLGTPKVIDFGIARALEVTSQHTRTDQMVGTVAYMAPERFDTGASRSVSPAADVFAWGAVVAYAGTGRTPFAADSAAATAARILTQPPDLTGLPGSLRDLVALSLAKDPAGRPSAHELLDLLLAAGPAATPAIPADLQRQAEAAQHSGRWSTDGTPVPPGRRRRRTWAWLAAGVAALAAVPLAVLAMEAGGGSGVAGPAGSPSASAVPADSISAVPAPAGASAAPGAVRGPSVVDPLSRPGQWSEVRGGSGGECTFDRRLVVTTGSASVYQCPGPTDTFAGDQTVAVDLTLDQAGSCGDIWFRYVDRSGYRLTVCPDSLKLLLDDDGDLSTLSTVGTPVFQVGLRHRLQIAVRSNVATVSVDGTPLLQGKTGDPALASGQVVLGAGVEGQSGSAQASFRNIAITPALAAAGAYTDVSAGDSTSVAKLLSYNKTARSAVVEPVRYYSGPGYCKAYHIASSDGRCNREWITEDSHAKVTVPLATSAKLTYVHGGDPDCMKSYSDIILAGTCALSPAAFASWLKDNAEALVRLTVKDGTTTGIAELFLP
jgi:predicted Ser/Thr protein kinase